MAAQVLLETAAAWAEVGAGAHTASAVAGVAVPIILVAARMALAIGAGVAVLARPEKAAAWVVLAITVMMAVLEITIGHTTEILTSIKIPTSSASTSIIM